MFDFQTQSNERVRKLIVLKQSRQGEVVSFIISIF